MIDCKRIWLDGRMVDYAQATLHMLSSTLHYGLGAFEGIRCYRTSGGRVAVFRLDAHVERLLKSSRAATIEVPFAPEHVADAILQVIRENDLEDGYIRPLVWLGEGSLRFEANNVVHLGIAAWPWTTHLGEQALEEGVRCCFSSFVRVSVGANLEAAKICGQYVNSVLAKRDATAKGFSEALLLDAQGYVTEGSGENLFVVRNGKIFTPPSGASLLPGITRETVMTLATDEGYAVEEALLTRSALFFADEIFMTGTAAEVTPVREIDGRTIGSGERGPITERLQKAFFALTRAENHKHEGWLTYV